MVGAIGGRGRYGANFAQDILSAWTGDAPQTQAGQLTQSVVSALPGIQSTVYQIANPGTLQALTRRVARLQAKLAAGGLSPQQEAITRADLNLAQQQLAELQGALQAPTAQPSQITAVSTVSWGWVPVALVGAVLIAGLTLFLSKRRRR